MSRFRRQKSGALQRKSLADVLDSLESRTLHKSLKATKTVSQSAPRRQLLGALSSDIASGNWLYARKTYRSTPAAVSTEVDYFGNFPLHWITKGDEVPIDFAELILASYPDAALKREKEYGFTPLHCACKHYKLGSGGKISMLIKITGHSGIAFIKDQQGRIPLDLFLENISNNYKINVEFPPYKALKMLPELQILWRATYGEFVTAAATKDWEKVIALMKTKVEGPMQKDKFGKIPIMYAVQYAAPAEVLELLCQAYPASEGVILAKLLQNRQWKQAIALMNNNAAAGLSFSTKMFFFFFLFFSNLLSYPC